MDYYIHLLPSETKITEQRGATGTVGAIPTTVKPAPVNSGVPLEGSWSAEKRERKEEEMEIHPSPSMRNGKKD
jgi:hypothetical protein